MQQSKQLETQQNIENQRGHIHDMSVFRFFDELVGDWMTDRPRGKYDKSEDPIDVESLSWFHFAELERDDNDEFIKKPIDFHACRTKQTLRGYILNEDYHWFSFNGYCSRLSKSKTRYDKTGKANGLRGGRRNETLRSIHAIGADIDNESIEFWWELSEMFKEAKLPHPTVINRTKRGYHCFWILDKPVKAYDGNKRLYSYITNNIKAALNKDRTIVDENALDVTRYLQVPRNIEYANYSYKPSWEDMKEWLNTYGPCNYKNRNEYKKNKVIKGDFAVDLDSIIRQLEEEAEEGNRNQICFILSCYYKNIGYSLDRTLNIMNHWNEKNGFNTPGKSGHSSREVLATVNSVYRKDYNIPYKMIEELTGCKCKRWYKNSKKRSERIRSHNKEYIKDIIYGMLEDNIGVYFGSQKELAEEYGIPLSTFKDIIKGLKNGKYGRLLIIKSEGKGRNARTIIQLNVRVFKKFDQHRLESYIESIFEEDDKMEDLHMDYYPIAMGGRGSP